MFPEPMSIFPGSLQKTSPIFPKSDHDAAESNYCFDLHAADIYKAKLLDGEEYVESKLKKWNENGDVLLYDNEDWKLCQGSTLSVNNPNMHNGDFASFSESGIGGTIVDDAYSLDGEMCSAVLIVGVPGVFAHLFKLKDGNVVLLNKLLPYRFLKKDSPRNGILEKLSL